MIIKMAHVILGVYRPVTTKVLLLFISPNVSQTTSTFVFFCYVKILDYTILSVGKYQQDLCQKS